MGFEIINFGTGKGTRLSELIMTAEELVGKKAIISYTSVPPGDARFVGVCDNRKAKRLLGWEPKTELRVGLKQTLDYMLNSCNQDSAVV